MAQGGEQLSHLRAARDHRREGLLLLSDSLQIAQAAREIQVLKRVVHAHRDSGRDAFILHQEVVGAPPSRLRHRAHGGVPRHDDHADPFVARHHGLKEVHALAVGQTQVEEHDPLKARLQRGFALCGRGRPGDLVTLLLQRGRHQLSEQRLVVDDQYMPVTQGEPPRGRARVCSLPSWISAVQTALCYFLPHISSASFFPSSPLNFSVATRATSTGSTLVVSWAPSAALSARWTTERNPP